MYWILKLSLMFSCSSQPNAECDDRHKGSNLVSLCDVDAASSRKAAGSEKLHPLALNKYVSILWVGSVTTSRCDVKHNQNYFMQCTWARNFVNYYSDSNMPR
jgi:hypothetical protein